MFDYVLFDLDGTLTRSGEGIKKSAAYAIAQMGFPLPDDATLTSFVGPPLLPTFMDACGMTREDALRAVEHYRARYQNTGWRENAVYPGIPALLRALKAAGKYLAVATGKPEKFARRIAEHFGMTPYLDAIAGVTMDDQSADKARLIGRALPPGADRRRAVMVGDRKFDVEGARAAGICSLAVGYGYGTRAELDGSRPDRFAETVDELFPLLGVSRPRGRFITFEGTDGCGKSTQMRRVGEWLEARGYELVRTREPGGCPLSERIREIVLSDARDESARGMTAECEALLFAASRAQHVHDVILPALEAGKYVLCDRFLDSSIAYQAHGRELGEAFVRQINVPAVIAAPDLTLLYMMDERAAHARVLAGDTLDRIEAEKADYFTRVTRAFRQLQAAEPGRIRLIDANGTIEDVLKRTLAVVEDFLIKE